MRKSYTVANVRCEGCANTIRRALAEHFSDGVAVDLDAMPRKVTVEITGEADEELLISTLRKLGYPLIDDEVKSIEGVVMKGKSFLSCAVGKFNPTKEKQ